MHKEKKELTEEGAKSFIIMRLTFLVVGTSFLGVIGIGSAGLAVLGLIFFLVGLSSYQKHKKMRK